MYCKGHACSTETHLRVHDVTVLEHGGRKILSGQGNMSEPPGSMRARHLMIAPEFLALGGSILMLQGMHGRSVQLLE